MTTNSDHLYTRYEYWCGNCGTPTVAWEDDPPVHCASCKKSGGTWDRCEIDPGDLRLDELRKIITAAENVERILKNDKAKVSS